MGKKLMLIEDNEELLELVSMIISARQGYDVIQMRDGNEAHQLLQKEKFDVIISDLVLDTMPGVEIIRQARARDKDVHIIAISGKGQQYLDQAIEAGANLAVPKPFTIAQMVAALEQGEASAS